MLTTLATTQVTKAGLPMPAGTLAPQTYSQHCNDGEESREVMP
jgi:hypothetical protein